MVKMIRDNKGRFAERPFYAARDLDDERERLIRDLLLKRHGKVDYPVATDDLIVLIEMHDAELDSYADLSAYGADVEGVTEFFPDCGRDMLRPALGSPYVWKARRLVVPTCVNLVGQLLGEGRCGTSGFWRAWPPSFS